MELVRRATPEDGRDIASRIRSADRREALDYVGVPPTVLLPLAAKKEGTMVGLDAEGVPQVMLGVEPVIGTPNMGIVWLVATKELENNRKAQMRFLRASRAILERLQEQYPILGNYVDERNELHLKWVKWLGFKIIKRVERWGWRGKPFLQIIRTRETI